MRSPAPSTPGRGFLQRRLAGMLVLLALPLSGCLTADGVLKADGTATLTLTYAAPKGSTEAMQREQLKAPGITIESLSIGEDRKVTAALRVTDLGGIGKMPLLKGTTVATGTEGDDKTLTIATLVKPLPRKPDESVPGPSIHVTVPGKIVEATKPGVVDGSSVKWAFSLRDWSGLPAWRLSVRYSPAPKEPDAPEAAKPD
jgi:hypothetical protein